MERGRENTASRHSDHSSGVNTDASLDTLATYITLAMDGNDNAKIQARSILGPNKDAEFLQSFVRVGIGDEEEGIPVPKATISKRAPPSASKSQGNDANVEKEASVEKKVSIKPRKSAKRKHKRERRHREEELYTDKDRAAAVVMGTQDIKQSLSMKDKAERTTAMHLPVEADAGTLLALARAELMRERYRTALSFVDKVFFYCISF